MRSSIPKVKKKDSNSWVQAKERALSLLRELYGSDSRPWLIGYSGGKDSTAVVQLVWHTLETLPKKKRFKPVFVISADVLVENPILAEHLTRSLDLMNVAAEKSGIPIHPHKVTPDIDETFWVNLIGRGYPAPYPKFRWCSERMKINPATRFIRKEVARYGEVIILLGARKAESSTRAQIMSSKKRKRIGQNLSRHHSLPGAWTLTPIEDWQTEEVWNYLRNETSPWGLPVEDLMGLYEGFEAAEEKPMVLDKSTTSAGRFGCWTCTLVREDWSLKAQIESGNAWLKPLNEFRNWLKDTQDPIKKNVIREHRRRTGRIQYVYTNEGKKLIWGPYKLSFRKEILRKLLITQKAIESQRPDLNLALIKPEELHKIRQLWQFEERDWEDSIPKIYFEVTGRDLEWLYDDCSGLGGAEKEILSKVSEQFDVPTELLAELMDIERKHYGMSKRSGIFQQIDRVLKKDWQSYDEALAELKDPAEKKTTS